MSCFILLSVVDIAHPMLKFKIFLFYLLLKISHMSTVFTHFPYYSLQFLLCPLLFKSMVFYVPLTIGSYCIQFTQFLLFTIYCFLSSKQINRHTHHLLKYRCAYIIFYGISWSTKISWNLKPSHGDLHCTTSVIPPCILSTFISHWIIYFILYKSWNVHG